MLNCFTAGAVFTPWPFRPKVYCCCLSVHPSFRPSLRELYLVRTITHHIFELESPNLHQTCILGYSQLVLKIGVIDLDLQGHFGHFDLEFLEIWVVRTTIRNRFGLEPQNLHQTWIMGYSCLISKIGVSDLDLQGHYGHYDSEFLEIWLVHAITWNGFGLQSPNLHQIYILRFSFTGIEYRGHWPWFSRPFGHFKSGFQEMAFNIALVYWSRPAKGYYTSQRALVFHDNILGLNCFEEIWKMYLHFQSFLNSDGGVSKNDCSWKTRTRLSSYIVNTMAAW